jgi:hypothetical protein
MQAPRLLSLSTIFVLGLCPLFAQSPDATTALSITITGTIGAVLSGSDPLKASGESGTIDVVASESLSPYKTTSTSATYVLPPGAVTVTIGNTTYKTTSSSEMTIDIPASGRDYLILTAKVTELNITITVTGTASLKADSYSASALTHPTTFTPSPQSLPPATSATGGGSKIKYTVFGSTTVLALSGTASNSASPDTLPEETPEQ